MLFIGLFRFERMSFRLQEPLFSFFLKAQVYFHSNHYVFFIGIDGVVTETN